jgi:ABC-2 type transport system ATP-binding protein
MTAILETRGLTKRYGARRGCQDVSLQVQAGHIFGLLGPNGAGKSTFVKMIVGLLKPTAGSAHICGFPCGSVQANKRLGYLPELFRYPDWLTAEEVLRFQARLAGMAPAETDRRAAEALALVGLAQHAGVRVRLFSKGMQQRLGIANALLHDPELVLLDEPSSALDPIGRHDIRLLLQELRERGKTVFLNTHLLEDVEALCDEVAFLHEGELKAQGALEQLLYGSGWELHVGGWSPDAALGLSGELGGAMTLQAVEEDAFGSAVLIVEGINRELGMLNARLVERGITLYEVQRRKSGLESWFLRMMQTPEEGLR